MPNAPTAAEVGEEHLVLEIRRDNDGRLRDVQRFLRKEPETVAIAMAREASEDCRTLLARLDAAQSALLAARRERETAYETTAQVRDALSEEILKLRSDLAAARREQQQLRNVLMQIRQGFPAHVSSELARAALAAAHGDEMPPTQARESEAFVAGWREGYDDCLVLHHLPPEPCTAPRLAVHSRLAALEEALREIRDEYVDWDDSMAAFKKMHEIAVRALEGQRDVNV